MGTDIEIALVLTVAFLWIVGTFAILSAIDRAERKARRQERKASRQGKRRIQYQPVVEGSRLEGQGRRHRPRRLRPH
ncbi:hypothetical protein CXX84_04685 [Arthrobacter sp. AFG7.2]|uniref:hypothetical protein n=1 Tax=Arthrobacter sp. AFG7.2 TaxID=1688693 RepID=UPI000C9E721A|nr:hypothetical protein [Arthrobacter sp. AFG7.2]PNI09551.1 hypothetical protein CXX84_04685 [Arthrobacter sp. AFG7.2]